jgi:hypothetical protein
MQFLPEGGIAKWTNARAAYGIADDRSVRFAAVVGEASWIVTRGEELGRRARHIATSAVF